MGNRFEVNVGAGMMRSSSGSAVSFPHRWTPERVTTEADFAGGHLLHLAAAGCVLNDVYREAAALGIEVKVAAAAARIDCSRKSRRLCMTMRRVPKMDSGIGRPRLSANGFRRLAS